MSGDIKDDLYTPVIYPHWMWVLGVALLVAVIGWVLFCLWRWWTSRVGEVTELHTITDARRKKYLVYVDQIADRYADGDLDARGVHLALAGLLRAHFADRGDLEVTPGALRAQRTHESRPRQVHAASVQVAVGVAIRNLIDVRQILLAPRIRNRL